ncbi:MAG: ROK family transcriptional regulator [Trueperaceae bacterium]|nr:MAG: ROK family transcriptional regulator [Trueperaceae bacterium]
MATPYQTEHVREANRHGVYRALASCGVATRTDLAQRTGLSSPTVAAILAEFHARGLVVEGGSDDGTGGRPAQRVRFVADAGHVLAIDLSGRHAYACRVDLTGCVRARHTGPALRPGGTDELIAWLGALLQAPDQPSVRRLALAVPGVIDPEDGRVDLAPALGWHRLDLAARLEAEFGVPVRLENDVNALALAELHYGAGARRRHVIYVAIGSGVGAGVVIDGRLYRGAHAAAGEIGSVLTRAEDADRPHAPGEPGPLERCVVAAAEGCLSEDGRFASDAPGAQAALDQLVRLLAPALHDVACLLDPELLVVAWPGDPDGHLAERLGAIWRGPRPVPIVHGTLGRDGAARGAAHLALDDIEVEICRHRARGPRPDPESDAHLAAAPHAPDPRSRHV